MNIEIVAKNIKNEAKVRDFIEEKVQLAVERIHARVGRIIVKLEDESKNSEAFAGKCQIDASILPTGTIHVSATSDTAFDTVLQATRKMEHAIKQDIDRHRRAARIRHQQSKQKFFSSLSDEEFAESEIPEVPEVPPSPPEN